MAAVGDPNDRCARAPRRLLLVDGVSAMLIAVLLISIVAAVRALAPVAWDALSRALGAERVTNPRQCALINTGRDRLACFDDYVKEMMRPPAKGAFVPPEVFGERERGSDAP